MRRAAAIVALLAACQSAPTPGATCARSADCASPLVCHFGRCRNACDADRDCSAGAVCLIDGDGTGTCSLDVDLGCQTGVGRMCPAGLVCIADRCAQVCSPSLGCATGSVCVPTGSAISFCAPIGTDAAIVGDAPSSQSPCDRIMDLEPGEIGTLALDVMANTTDAPATGNLPFTCVAGASQIVHQVAFRYRMRATAFLRVDTTLANTPANFDTVAAILDSCGPAAGTIGCRDDSDADIRARALSHGPVTVGTEVIIAVGGYDPAGTSSIEWGPLELGVTEIPVVNLGDACDPAALTSACAASACALTGTSTGTCVLPTDEIEENAVVPQALGTWTTPIVMHGSLGANDVDCFELSFTGTRSLLVSPSDGHGACPAHATGLDIVVRNTTGMVARATGTANVSPCVTLDGTAVGAMGHDLAAGTYDVCVSSTTSYGVPDYDLSIALVP